MHVKLLSVTRNNLLIRRVGNTFIEFSTDYTRHGRVYGFKDADMVINDFIENVVRPVLSDENDETDEKSAIELHGRRLYANFCFTA